MQHAAKISCGMEIHYSISSTYDRYLESSSRRKKIVYVFLLLGICNSLFEVELHLLLSYISVLLGSVSALMGSSLPLLGSVSVLLGSSHNHL